MQLVEGGVRAGDDDEFVGGGEEGVCCCEADACGGRGKIRGVGRREKNGVEYGGFVERLWTCA